MDLNSILIAVGGISILILIFFSGLYVLTILCVKRFHNAINVLTANFCIAAALCALIRAVLDFIVTFHLPLAMQSSALCVMNRSFPYIFNALPVYAVVIIAINRYLIIRHPTKRVFTSITCSLTFSILQWMVTFVLGLPHLIVAILVSIAGFQQEN